MTLWQWGLTALATVTLLAAMAAAALMLITRKTRRLADHAAEIAILCRRLIADSRVSQLQKLKLRALVGYLALPLDLIPDFIPIIGRLDDALIAGVAIRVALRSTDAHLIDHHWPGTQPPPRAIARRGRLRRATNHARPSAAS
jgi:uncharacterized membrane protein YkvA (DUF1232 family)